MTVGDKLIASWRNQADLNLRPPVRTDGLAEFERSNQLSLPTDFADYLLCADGFDQESGYQDNEGFTFWPLSRITALSRFDFGKFFSEGFGNYFIFADYLDFSWGYAIHLETNVSKLNEIAIVGTANGCPQIIASTFSEFANLYLAKDSRLFTTS